MEVVGIQGRFADVERRMDVSMEGLMISTVASVLLSGDNVNNQQFPMNKSQRKGVRPSLVKTQSHEKTPEFSNYW